MTSAEAPHTSRLARFIRSDRAAALLFGVATAVALPVILHFGRNRWFFLDEWDFLAGPPLLSVDGLLGDHNGHWVTTPRIVFRALFEIFGVRTYRPYQLLVVLSHLGVVVLIRAVLRRAGVNAWLATAAAGALLLLGSGEQNLLFAFQISLNGSLICGLAALLLAADDGPFSRRDGAAIAVAIVGLSTSGVMVPMIVGIAVAMGIRRGRNLFLLYAIPPGVVFSGWFLMFGRDAQTQAGSTLGGAVEFFADLNWAVFKGLGQHPVLAAILLLTAVAGLAVSAQGLLRGGRRPGAEMTVALSVAWLTFAAVTSVSRNGLAAIAPGLASSSRYVHVGAVLLMPAFALGAQRLAELRPPAVAVPALALAAGVPGNIATLAEPNPFEFGQPRVIDAIASSAYLDDLPGDQPVAEDRSLSQSGAFSISRFGPMNVNWIRRGIREGFISTPQDVAPQEQLTVDLVLVTAQVRAADQSCTPATGALKAELNAGDRLTFDGQISIVAFADEVKSRVVQFESINGETIEVLGGPMTLEATPQGPNSSVCTSTG